MIAGPSRDAQNHPPQAMPPHHVFASSLGGRHRSPSPPSGNPGIRSGPIPARRAAPSPPAVSDSRTKDNGSVRPLTPSRTSRTWDQGIHARNPDLGAASLAEAATSCGYGSLPPLPASSRFDALRLQREDLLELLHRTTDVNAVGTVVGKWSGTARPLWARYPVGGECCAASVRAAFAVVRRDRATGYGRASGRAAPAAPSWGPAWVGRCTSRGLSARRKSVLVAVAIAALR